MYAVISHRRLDGVYRSKAAAERLAAEIRECPLAAWQLEQVQVIDLDRPNQENDLVATARQRAQDGHFGRMG